MSFLKRRWFGFIVSLIVAAFILVFLIVLFAPRQDVQKRGFIPCTEIMARELLSCSENKAVCMLGAVMKNTWCDAGVIYEGFADWIKGRQPAPWSNYYFTPELPASAETDDEELREFYDQTPDVGLSMQKLLEQNRRLEENIGRDEDLTEKERHTGEDQNEKQEEKKDEQQEQQG